jgi:hypothetical protein
MRGEKTVDRRYRKIRNRIIVGLLIMMAILIFWNYISDLHKHIDLLIKHNQLQSVEIDKLHNEITSQHKEITSLQHQVTYITNKESASIKVQYTQVPTAVKHEHHFESNPLDTISSSSAVIVTAVTIIGGLLKNLVPSF